jgi:glutamyl-tRNA synthetase
MTDSVRVRFAPSPTGPFHIGGARTALFNWLFARHHGGAFVLRIEDTDQKRYDSNALSDLLGGLRWLELDWDEGPEVGGDYGPYFQTQRADLYRHWANWLVKQGHAYRCYCSPERLAQMRQEQRSRGEQVGYDRHCRYLTAAQRAEHEVAGDSCVVRLAMPIEGTTSIQDLIRGPITVENRTQDDLILLKSDGLPTYHLANVVDDHFMEISHILRADEWIPTAPRHARLYEAFGWEMPAIAHLPIILDPSGKGKISKRKKQVGGQVYYVLVHEFEEAGYLPETMLNFLAKIGWGMDAETEVFDREEAIARFDLSSVNPAPASPPYSKLDWLNGVYIRQMQVDELARRIYPAFVDAGLEADPETVLAITPLIQERLKTLNDAVPLTGFFFEDEITYEPEALIGKRMDASTSLAALQRAHETLADIDTFDQETLETALRTLADKLDLKAGQLFGIIRMATTGKKVAPPLFGTLAVLGRDRTLARLESAEEQLNVLTVLAEGQQ